MIAFLEGVVRFAGPDWAVIQVGGVGYKIFCVGCRAKIGDTVAWHIYDHIREDRRELFAFDSVPMRSLFEKLIDISGIGTRLAQKILNAGSFEQVSGRIMKGDIAFLTSISGVGKKTAQKILLELQGKLVDMETSREDADAMEALTNLGYARQDVANVLRGIEADTVEQRVKEALKQLGR